MSKFLFVVVDDYQERRSSVDRRSELKETTFPLLTKQGTWVRKECRKRPERRLENINVAETQLNADEFKELFKNYC